MQREIRQAITDLRKQKSKDSIEQTRRVLASVQERLKSEVFKTPSQPEQKAEPEETISPGDTVWLKEAEIEATVLAVREETGEIEVQAGQTKIKLGLDGVDKIVPSAGGNTPRFVPVIRPPQKIVPYELLLLGKRAEEVENLVNSYLDAASLTNLNQVRIVHGSGTGVLRSIVREMLAHHPLVKEFRPGEKGEGGNGVTVVKL